MWIMFLGFRGSGSRGRGFRLQPYSDSLCFDELLSRTDPTHYWKGAFVRLLHFTLD